jgi:hypothetical protein
MAIYPQATPMKPRVIVTLSPAIVPITISVMMAMVMMASVTAIIPGIIIAAVAASVVAVSRITIVGVTVGIVSIVIGVIIVPIPYRDAEAGVSAGVGRRGGQSQRTDRGSRHKEIFHGILRMLVEG